MGSLVLEELFELPLGSLGLEFEAHDMSRGRRNEPHRALATIPRLVAHGIEERGEGILRNLLGSWKPLGETTSAVSLLKFRLNGLTECSDSVNYNHASIVTHTHILSNGIINSRQLFYTSVLGFRPAISGMKFH